MYNFIKLTPTNAYATIIDKNNSSRYMCFKDPASANKCVSHICSYRSKHGHWPTFDLSEERHRIEPTLNVKKRKPEELRKYFDIVALDEEEFNDMCRTHHVSIFYCHAFDIQPLFSGYHLHMEAEEIDSVTDIDEYKNQLNQVIDRR